MTASSSDLRKIVTEARPLIETWLDTAEKMAALRDAAADLEIDWSALKALIKAHIQDEQDGKDRVGKLLAKADASSSYADMLGFGGEEKNFSAPAVRMARAAAKKKVQTEAIATGAVTEDGEVIEPPRTVEEMAATIVGEAERGNSEAVAVIAAAKVGSEVMAATARAIVEVHKSDLGAAYTAGAQACARGEDEAACTYEDPRERDTWLTGYREWAARRRAA